MRKQINSTKARILAVLVFAIATVTAGAGSLALVTDHTIVNAPQQVETIVLTANGQKTLNIPLNTWRDANSKSYFPLLLRNAGNGELRYAVASTASGNSDLNSALLAAVKFNADPTRCTVDQWSGLGTGPISDVTPDNFDFGNPAQGAQAGDRLLAPGQESMMCVELRYAGGVTDGSVMNWTLNLYSESTYQNP